MEAEALEMETLLAALVAQVAPQLLDEIGFGVVTAAATKWVARWPEQNVQRNKSRRIQT